MKQKNLFVVLILVIVTLIGTVWYLAFTKKNLILNQSTPTISIIKETADWKIYSDKKSGFEIKYPQTNWIKLEEGPNTGVFCKGTEKIDKNTNQPYIESQSSINISVIDNPKNLPLQDLLIENSKESCKGDEMGGCGPEDISTWKSITINGFSVIRSGMHPVAEGVPTDYAYIKIKNKYIFLFASVSPFFNVDKDCLDVESVLDKVVYTFKLTK